MLQGKLSLQQKINLFSYIKVNHNDQVEEYTLKFLSLIKEQNHQENKELIKNFVVTVCLIEPKDKESLNKKIKLLCNNDVEKVINKQGASFFLAWNASKFFEGQEMSNDNAKKVRNKIERFIENSPNSRVKLLYNCFSFSDQTALELFEKMLRRTKKIGCQTKNAFALSPLLFNKLATWKKHITFCDKK